MSRARNGSAPDSSYQWPGEDTRPSRVQWTPAYYNDVHTSPDPPKALPDVPLDVQNHRYCTPPPLDSRYMAEPVGPKDDFPPYLDRAPSPDDFDELTGARPPLTVSPRDVYNPVVVQDDDNARRHRAQQEPIGPPPGLENSPRRSTRNSGQSQPSPSSSSSKSGTSSSSRSDKGKARAGPAAAPEPPVGQARFKKTRPDGFSPQTSSPLKKVAFNAQSKKAAAPPVPTRWEIPPRKHSVAVSSVCSSDSEYSD